MKYLILIMSNPAMLELWETLSESEQVALGNGHAAFHEVLAASGELIIGEGLADPSLGKRVAVHDGRTETRDGPFAEVKEHLAGFYLVECESMERAVELAAQVPDATFGTVEVRPVLTRADMEW